MATEKACEIGILVIQFIIVTTYQGVLPFKENIKSLSKTHSRMLKY